MPFPSDIEISQAAKMQDIRDIAKNAGIEDEYLECYGKYKAKIDGSFLNKTKLKDGKLILVSAIT
ncbi:MAG TPA: formate--tetrahydrofolate ligase, partial [Clostridia bacterium]|nr:formate--tetrahydrofolate ligase [Clostridia bacterium]